MEHMFCTWGAEGESGQEEGGCTCGGLCSVAATDTEFREAFHDWFDHHCMEDPEQQREFKRLSARRAVSELGADWLKFEQAAWRAKAPDGRPREAREMILAWGWWSSINRYACAVLLLESGGLSDELVPVFRKLLEKTLALTSLAHYGDDVIAGRWLEQMKVSASLNHDSFPDSAWNRGREARDAPRTPIDSSVAWTTSLAGICKKFGVTSSIYAYYRLLSRWVHPSTLEHDSFSKLMDDGKPALGKVPQTRLDVDLLHWTAACLIWAAQAFECFVEESPFGSSLELAITEQAIPKLADMKSGWKFGIRNAIRHDRIESLYLEEWPSFPLPGRQRYTETASVFIDDSDDHNVSPSELRR